MNYLTSMTTTDTEKFLINKKFSTLLSVEGVIMGERINGKMHIYLGGKKSYHA